MIDFILWLLLVGLLLFLFSGTVRTWVLLRILKSIQRRMTQHGGQSYRSYSWRSGASTSQTSSSYEEKHDSTSKGSDSQGHRGKLDIGDIVAKKFDKSPSQEYIDFEELPK